MAVSTGPYDELYGASPGNVLWRGAQSHLMAKLEVEGIQGTILDAGCGDGINAIYLERRGFSIHGIDVSEIALTGLQNRFADNEQSPRGRYERADLHDWSANEGRFSALVSCGLFHCLDRTRRHSLHKRMQDSVSLGGLVLFSCLTNAVSLPKDHLTPNLELVDISEIHELFQGMLIEYFREGVIQDVHEGVVGPHEHSLVWVIARRTT